jgi:hypothetical protein
MAVCIWWVQLQVGLGSWAKCLFHSEWSMAGNIIAYWHYIQLCHTHLKTYNHAFTAVFVPSALTSFGLFWLSEVSVCYYASKQFARNMLILLYSKQTDSRLLYILYMFSCSRMHTFYECAQYFRHPVSCAKGSDWKACRARVFWLYTCSSSVSGIYEAFWSSCMMVSLCCHYCLSYGIYKSLNMCGWCQVALPGMAERGSKVFQTMRYDE